MTNLRAVTVTVFLTTLAGLSLHAQITGSGSKNAIAFFTGGTSIGDSVITNINGNVGINVTSPKWGLDVGGHINTSSGYLIGGSLMLTAPGGVGSVAVGYQALNSDTAGDNTAVGFQALYLNTSASFNVAVGAESLYQTTGSENTGIGYNVLSGLTTGTGNVAIGANAGISAPAAVTNSVYVLSQGASTDNNVIRIGTQNTQQSFYAAGIFGTTVGGAQLIVNANGQLGVASSSRRFKEDIQDMGDSSSGLLRLRPVTFRYKQAYEDGSKPVDYGLIAEEVAEIYPDLAVRGADGQIMTVQYQKLTPMLLNEVQKQHQLVEQQAETIRQLQRRLEALEATVRSAR